MDIMVTPAQQTTPDGLPYIFRMVGMEAREKPNGTTTCIVHLFHEQAVW